MVEEGIVTLEKFIKLLAFVFTFKFAVFSRTTNSVVISQSFGFIFVRSPDIIRDTTIDAGRRQEEIRFLVRKILTNTTSTLKERIF